MVEDQQPRATEVPSHLTECYRLQRWALQQLQVWSLAQGLRQAPLGAKASLPVPHAVHE